jgi:hypothetical protein
MATWFVTLATVRNLMRLAVSLENVNRFCPTPSSIVGGTSFGKGEFLSTWK